MAVFDEPLSSLPNKTLKGLGDEYNTNLDAIKKTVDELEARYQKPNWFNIAAGFAKPQLGGFIASLGSAAEAQGKNIEQQRQMAIPIAQMRAQLGLQQAVMGQNKQASDVIHNWEDQWKQDHPGQALPPTPPDVIEKAARLSPNLPAVQAARKVTEDSRAQQELTTKAITNRLEAIRLKYQKGGVPTPQEQAFLNNPYGNIVPNQAPDFGNMSTSGGVNTPAPNAGNATATTGTPNPAASTGTTGAGAQTSAQPVKYFPQSHPMPNPDSLVAMSDPAREALIKAHTTRATAEEDANQAKHLAAGKVATGPNYLATKALFDGTQQMYEENPEAAMMVHDIIRKGGPIVAALDAGIGAHLGSLTANISLPIQAWKEANLPEEYRSYADKLLSNLVSLGNAKLASQGVTLRPGEEKAFIGQLKAAANLGQTAPAALNIIHHDKTNFEYNKDFYDTINKELASGQVDPNSLTHITDVMRHSKALHDLNDEYAKKHANFDQQFNDAIKGATEARKQKGEAKRQGSTPTNPNGPLDADTVPGNQNNWENTPRAQVPPKPGTPAQSAPSGLPSVQMPPSVNTKTQAGMDEAEAILGLEKELQTAYKDLNHPDPKIRARAVGDIQGVSRELRRHGAIINMKPIS